MGQFRWRVQDHRVLWGIVLLLRLRVITAAVMNLKRPTTGTIRSIRMVAWVVRTGTLLLGKFEIGVSIGGLALVVVSTWLINALGCLAAERISGRRSVSGPTLTPD